MSEKSPRTLSFEYLSKKYILREPLGTEIVESDNIKSSAWFEAVEKRVRIEDEILASFEKQGRFNRIEHDQRMDSLAREINLLLAGMTTAKDQDELNSVYRDVVKLRNKMISEDRIRQSLTLNSAEQKAENAYYLTMLGFCLLTGEEDPTKRKQVFAVFREDTNIIDTEAMYRAMQDWPDQQLVTMAISYFMPFLRGFNNIEDMKMPEDLLYDELLKKMPKSIEDKTPEVSVEQTDDIVEDMPEYEKYEASEAAAMEKSKDEEDLPKIDKASFYAKVAAKQGGAVDTLEV